MGIAPIGHSSRFARPDDKARFRSLARAEAAGNKSRDRLAVTMIALVNVRESCGTTAISKLRQTSPQVGTTRRGTSNDGPRLLGRTASFVTHPATAAVARTSGAAGHRG